MAEERKTHLAAKLAILETNQPGFVNDGGYFNPAKPRKPFVVSFVFSVFMFSLFPFGCLVGYAERSL